MENWLRQLRDEAGITSQDDLSDLLTAAGYKKASRSAVSNWESGRTPPPIKDPEFVKILAAIFRITENEIMLAAGYRITTKHHTQISERIANMVDDLPPDKQELALRLVAQLKG